MGKKEFWDLTKYIETHAQAIRHQSDEETAVKASEALNFTVKAFSVKSSRRVLGLKLKRTSPFKGKKRGPYHKTDNGADVSEEHAVLILKTQVLAEAVDALYETLGISDGTRNRLRQVFGQPPVSSITGSHGQESIRRQ